MQRFAQGKLRLCFVSSGMGEKGDDVPETTAFQASDQDLDGNVISELGYYL